MVSFLWSAYVCMSTYKCNVIAVVKMGAYIHGVLFYFLWMPIILIYVELKKLNLNKMSYNQILCM